jgi:hypothetical protein
MMWTGCISKWMPPLHSVNIQRERGFVVGITPVDMAFVAEPRGELELGP